MAFNKATFPSLLVADLISYLFHEIIYGVFLKLLASIAPDGDGATLFLFITKHKNIWNFQTHILVIA
ncbi:hypothetical protein ASG66_16695 [Bacillus sp. Leaf406]|nr:hypothetical protein ASG66_16695 [Bacillus sp. Leaf406]